jgi:hypothetical protein
VRSQTPLRRRIASASVGRGATAWGIIGLCALFLSLATAHAAATPPQPRRVALVIGNSAYKSLTPLANPANDARLVATTLAGLGFELVGGGARLDLDKAGFDRVVQDFGAALQDADVGLFYYAGHGLQVQGTNWLVPIGANPSGPQDVDFQMVDANLVLKQMQFAKTRLNIVILDACRNNPFGGRGLRAVGGGLAEMRAPQGTLIAYATQPDSVAHDGAGADSPFTTALAHALVQPGLDLFRLFNQVGLAVKRETGGDQQPWVSSSPIEGDFYFSPASASAAVTLPVPDADLLFWQGVVNSRDPADYRAYLRQFPKGRYAELAQQRLDASATRLPQPASSSDKENTSQTAPSALLSMLWRRPSPTSPTRPESPAGAPPPLFYAAASVLDNVASDVEQTIAIYVTEYRPAPNGYGRIGSAFDKSQLLLLRTLQSSLSQGSSASSAVGYMELAEPLVLPRGGATLQDPPQLTDAVQAFLAASQVLRSRFDEARPYYDQDSYKDDNFARGRAMHPGLMSAINDFIAARTGLLGALRRLADGERQTYLNGLPPSERAVKAGVIQAISQARDLVRFIATSLDANRDIRRIDPARLKYVLDQYERSIGQLRAVLPADSDSPLGMRMGFFMDRASGFLNSGRYLWRTVRDHSTVVEAEFRFREGGESDIIVRFNHLVSAAGRVTE